jgi:hypothetical protein
MPGRIALERFGSSSPGDDALAAGVDMPVPDHEAAPGADALESDIDPKVERTACLARIASALEIAASEQAALRARCIADTTEAFGKAAEAVLPQLARAGFAALIAEATQAIARRGQWPELLVTVAPEDAAAVTDALASPDNGLNLCPKPGPELKITEDPALGPGEAHLGWSQGGAEIDVEAIAETALERFRLQLDGCLQQGAC